VRNNNYIENEYSSIEFLCMISTVLLKSEPHELRKSIAEIHNLLYKHSDQFNISDDIKVEIKNNIH
ncbi:7476_t:CDS:2, partial [Scutellospora calospora]